jgi:hypothetical protein
MHDNNTPHTVIGGMLGYRCSKLPWPRQARLRVTEFLTDTPLFTIKSSLDVPSWKIRDVLDSIHPDWQLEEYFPTPVQTDRQLRALCEKFSNDIVAKIGRPSDYPTQKAINAALNKIYREAVK